LIALPPETTLMVGDSLNAAASMMVPVSASVAGSGIPFSHAAMVV
jgi:hypothetical protein